MKIKNLLISSFSLMVCAAFNLAAAASIANPVTLEGSLTNQSSIPLLVLKNYTAPNLSIISKSVPWFLSDRIFDSSSKRSTAGRGANILTHFTYADPKDPNNQCTFNIQQDSKATIFANAPDCSGTLVATIRFISVLNEGGVYTIYIKNA